MSDHISSQLYERACQILPGGVNSPVRSFAAVPGDPIFIQKAKGAYLIGADGRQYVDYIGSWGPMIVGHAHPYIIQAVKQAIERGFSYGAPTEAEIELAEAIQEAVPSVEMMRMTSSGTEAVMGALRVARGFTGRDLVLKFIGCYHGGADYLLVKAGSGAATFGEPDSAGIPLSIASTTLLAPYNDVEAVGQIFQERGSDIAAVIVEPVVGNMGCIPPDPGFLEFLRETTKQADALLIFDEVMTGFRLAYGGAQERFGIQPDLTTLGKIVGGGLPVGVYGGRRDVMNCVSPLGPVYQAGTLSGNPLATAAGLATLQQLCTPGVYQQLENIGEQLEKILHNAAMESCVPVSIQRVGSMLTVYFTEGKVRSWQEASKCDTEKFGRWHSSLLNRGIYWPASQFEAAFISLAHGEDILEITRKAATEAFASL